MIPPGYTACGPPVVAGEATVTLVRGAEGKFLWLSRALAGFEGKALPTGSMLCPLSFVNARALGALLPWLLPRRLPASPSFGFGDRLGLATPGHVRAVGESRVFPFLAQQSVRENARTGRTFADVLASAVFGALAAGHEKGFGADADHLKDVDDALLAADLGYTFFTCDPSDHVGPVDRTADVQARFRCLPQREAWRKEYLGRAFSVGGRKLLFTEDGLARAAVKYGEAVAFAAQMYRVLRARLPHGFDFELSVDETETPTTPLEHLFIALELRRYDVPLASLAPRFPGEMEKAVDYRGDLGAFRDALRAHVAIARAMGPYRISLHSGSDKFRLYPILAEEAGDLWHVKTAGTSYLVALAIVARFTPALFRDIFRLALSRFPTDRTSYYLSTDPARIPDLERVPDQELPALLADCDARQVLHVTFGSVLRSELAVDLRAALSEHEEEYHQALATHLRRHLTLLGVRGNG
ncbi:MAG: D-tagaturonate epimerase UxaE [Candidatus Bipolaricaulota bacterium]